MTGNRAIAKFCLVALLVLQAAHPSSLVADAAFQQQEAAWQDFSNWNKAIGVSSHAFQELMGDDDTKALIEDYGNAVLVITISKELFHSGDMTAAVLLIKDKLQDKIIEKIAPGFHAWMGWMTWAKTGMELFKDLVFDPMVEQSQIDTYVGLRRAGNEPEDAFAGVRGYGYIVERAKKEFRRQYGDQPFQTDSDDLLPAWEEKFLQFIKAGMESKYQEKLHEELIERFQAEAAAQQARLSELREQLLLRLQQAQVGRLQLDPSTAELSIGEEVVFTAIAVYADPSAPRSAADVTADCIWSGSPGDNIYVARSSDAGRTLTITADYYGVVGSASVTVLSTDCGDHGSWNSSTRQCDCDSGYVWHKELQECVETDFIQEGQVEEVLGDLEVPFYDAIRMFDDHYDNFVAAISASADRSADAICADAALAFSFTRAAAAYELVASLYAEALDRVGRGMSGLNWQAVAAGIYETDIHVLDQIRLEMFHKDYQKVSEKGENLPTLLAQYAPGCDPEEMIALGSRSGEIDQNAETGVDGGGFIGSGGDPGGGGSGSGELRMVRTGEPFTQIKNRAFCSGGTLTINVTPPAFPEVIRPGDTVTLTVAFTWSASGSNLDDWEVVAVVFFGEEIKESQAFTAFSGSRTERFSFSATESLFQDAAMAINITVGGGIVCQGGSSDDAVTQYTQAYVRMGSR
ncbi:hypothetical protein JW992_14325 [candidate division KSB1 bacterium]|nr:hypothetical protein [candidate division KSB1 bacterium]